jgi:hypothetical protein
MKFKYVTAGVTTLVGSGIVAASALSIANADAASTGANVDIGTSSITRTVFRNDRLEAEAQVLNTTTANVQAAHKDKTFARLLTNAGLTKQTFHEKVKVQLTTDLENQGYSANQVAIALQHRMIVGMHHHKKS